MIAVAPRLRKPRAFLKAFLLLWGGWTIVGFLWAFLRSIEPIIGIVIAVAAWISQAGAELNFRSRNLPYEARKPWHALAVLFVIPIPFLVGELGPEYANHVPGVLRSKEVHELQIIPDSFPTEKILRIHVECGWRKTNWGASVRSVRFTESKVFTSDEELAWIIDASSSEAVSVGEPRIRIKLDQDGTEEVIRTVVSGSFAEDQVEVAAQVLRKGLAGRSGRTPQLNVLLFPRSKYRVGDHYVGNVANDISWPYVVATVFSLALFPVTWIVLRLTMFPRTTSAI